VEHTPGGGREDGGTGRFFRSKRPREAARGWGCRWRGCCQLRACRRRDGTVLHAACTPRVLDTQGPHFKAQALACHLTLRAAQRRRDQQQGSGGRAGHGAVPGWGWLGRVVGRPWGLGSVLKVLKGCLNDLWRDSRVLNSSRQLPAGRRSPSSARNWPGRQEAAASKLGGLLGPYNTFGFAAWPSFS
jgi:hypothetical protein